MNIDDVNSRKVRKNCFFVLSDFFLDRKYFLKLKLEMFILIIVGNLIIKYFVNVYFYLNNIFIVMEF